MVKISMLAKLRVGAGGVLVVLAGCAKPPTLMPAPALYSSAAANLSEETLDARKASTIEVLYATDRQYDPSLAPDPYPPERERFLRLGVARVSIGPDDLTWSDLASASTTTDRDRHLEMHLQSVDDFGPLAETTIPFDPISVDPAIGEAGRRYADLVNQRLAESASRDICIFIAPFKTRFDQVVAMAAEFHHYLGRDGVFIAYAWPSHQSNLSYLNAVENAYRTRRCLRVLFEFLAAETNVEQVHFLTYSAGARVLSGVLHELTLTSRHMDDSTMRERLPLGQLILCAPDIDSGAFLEHMVEWMDRVPGTLTVYTHTRDRALGLSRRLYGNDRLGMLDRDDFEPQGRDVLMQTDRIAVVSVNNARDVTHGSGHSYFRLSPWVSTDVLLILGRSLPPAERGLTRAPEDPIWRFPDDYPDRIPDLTGGEERLP